MNNTTQQIVLTLNLQIAAIFGSTQAQILNQIQYWISKCGREIKNETGLWIYNSLREWQNQFPYYSESTIRRKFKHLESLGVLKSKKANAKRWNQTKWYSIDETRLSELCSKSLYHTSTHSEIPFVQNEQIDPLKMNKCYKYTKNYLYKSSSKKSSINSFQATSIKEEEILEKTKRRRKEGENKIIPILTKKTSTSNHSNPTAQLNQRALLEREQTTLQAIISTWNKAFSYSLKPIKAYTNRKNSPLLLKLFHTTFGSSLDKWKSYALAVNSSKFLMGEKQTNFKATFSWLIKQDVAQAILAGEYGVGDRELDLNNVKQNIEEQKNNIIKKIDDKLSSMLEKELDIKEEEREFTELITAPDGQRGNDGWWVYSEDKYNLRAKMKSKGVYDGHALDLPQHKKLKESLFKDFLMEKRYGSSRQELRRKAWDCLSTFTPNNCDVISRLREISSEVERHDPHQARPLLECLQLAEAKETDYSSLLEHPHYIVDGTYDKSNKNLQ